MHAACCNVTFLLFDPYPFIWAVVFVTYILAACIFPPFCASPLSHMTSHHLSARRLYIFHY